MAVLFNLRTWIASVVVGAISHWVAAHPGVLDPFYVGTLIGVILHALHVTPEQVPGGGGA